VSAFYKILIALVVGGGLIAGGFNLYSSKATPSSVSCGGQVMHQGDLLSTRVWVNVCPT
jgi:hypothetical protein